MSELFDEEDILDESFEEEESLTIDTSETSIMDARRRLEKKLEEMRLRDELDDFVDFDD